MKMTNTVMKPAWAGATLRLDPSRFPQQVTYALRGALGDVTITIDERGAVLRKILPGSGLPLSFALPARAFKGVAAYGKNFVDILFELIFLLVFCGLCLTLGLGSYQQLLDSDKNR